MNQNQLQDLQRDPNKTQYNPSTNGYIVSKDGLDEFLNKYADFRKKLMDSLLDDFRSLAYDIDEDDNDVITREEDGELNIIYNNEFYHEFYNDKGIYNYNVPASWNFLVYKEGNIETSKNDGMTGITPRVSVNVEPIDNWDLSASLDFLVSHAYPCYDKKTCGMCATAVKNALAAGGFAYIRGNAHNMHTDGILESMGFTWINTISSSANMDWTRAEAEPGDIAVYFKPPYGTSQPGHICMWSGSQWISDFKQNSAWVYPGRSGDIWIYRYLGNEIT